MGFGKDGRGQIWCKSQSQALGALANQTVLATTPTTMNEDFRILRSDVWVAWYNKTSGEGPLLFGLAAGQYSAAEIEEYLEGAFPDDPEANAAIELSNRAIWPLGWLSDDGSDNIPRSHFTWTQKWTFGDDGWTWWVYCHEEGALTTGSALKIVEKNYGVWVR